MRAYPNRSAAAAAVLAALFLGAPPQASAQSQNITEIPATIRVSPDDSAEEIYAKIEAKARRLCRTVSIRPYDRIAMERACQREFMDDAIRALGRVDLAELHRAKSQAKTG